MNVRGYHFVNLALHGGVSALLFAVLVRLGFGSALSVLSALLFAVHPIHTEAVAGLVGRAELLAAACVLLSMLAYDTSPNISISMLARCLLSLALVSAAYLCKETGMTVLAVLFVQDCCAADDSRPCEADKGGSGSGDSDTGDSDSVSSGSDAASPPPRGRRGWGRPLRLLLLLCCAAALLFLRRVVTREPAAAASASSAATAAEAPAGTASSGDGSGGGFIMRGFRRLDNPIPFIDDVTNRRLTIAHTWSIYLWLLLYPRSLSCDYSYNAIPAITGTDDPRNAATAAALLSVALCLLLLLLRFDRRSRGRALVAVTLAVAPFIPASNLLFHPGTMIAERVLYMPSMGYCALLPWLSASLLRLLRTTTPPPSSSSTAPRPTSSSSSSSSAAPAPPAAAAAASSTVKLAVGSGAPGLLWLSALTALWAWYVSLTWRRNAQWDNQVSLFASALLVAPGSAKVQLNVGINAWDESERQVVGSDAQARLLTRALSHLHAAERIDPGFCQVHYWAGRVRLQQHDYNKAVARFQSALDCRELRHHEFAQEALVAFFTEVLRHNPRNADAHSNLANILLLQQHFEQAVTHFYKALSLVPDHPSFLANLGYARLLQGRFPSAIAVLRRALSVQPVFPVAASNLQKAQAAAAAAASTATSDTAAATATAAAAAAAARAEVHHLRSLVAAKKGGKRTRGKIAATSTPQQQREQDVAKKAAGRRGSGRKRGGGSNPDPHATGSSAVPKKKKRMKKQRQRKQQAQQRGRRGKKRKRQRRRA